MRHNPSEKLEIIRIVEDSELSVRQTLKEIGIHCSTFYNWYRRYLEDGAMKKSPKVLNVGGGKSFKFICSRNHLHLQIGFSVAIF